MPFDVHCVLQVNFTIFCLVFSFGVMAVAVTAAATALVVMVVDRVQMSCIQFSLPLSVV